ncbi:thioredoxin family protein [Sulfurimonas sp. ST-25]|uniref:thioredoxin family protein n=1 Tax=Sulfurimonas sp. ST-25 TaxID=3400151 RepID=UPI003A885B1A
MKIEILGTGCSKCNELEAKVKQAVAKSGKFLQVEKVSDLQKIMAYGVMSTPGLVIDGEVKSTGRVPSVDEILAMIA